MSSVAVIERGQELAESIERSLPGQAQRAAEAPVLVCADVEKRFGERTAVKGISLSVYARETFGLLGPNGAGKTTTISIIAGVLAADAGTVTVAGEAVEPGRTGAKSSIGLVPQDLAIYPDMSARENLVFFGRLEGLGGSMLSDRVNEVLEIVDLAERADERTARYSGGMKRRLNIAIGLLHRPKLLILDEPTVGVDPQSRNAILESVDALSAEGMAILYTTHYMEEAERLCDRLAIVDEGRIVAEGTRTELVGLVGELDRVTLAATGDVRAAVAALRALSGVRGATADDRGISVIVDGARQRLPAILQSVAGAGAVVRSVDVVEPDLEAVFLHLTGKALRD